jgi:hypothetical protein
MLAVALNGPTLRGARHVGALRQPKDRAKRGRG